jgi:hypothetical protein
MVKGREIDAKTIRHPELVEGSDTCLFPTEVATLFGGMGIFGLSARAACV